MENKPTKTTKPPVEPENKIKPIDIVNNPERTYSAEQVKRAWVQILSSQPPKAWLKNTDPQKPDNKWLKDGNGKLIPYMPIEVIEMLMDKLLMFPKIRITNSGVGGVYLENGQRTIAFMNIELEYYNHGRDEWSYTSGSASMEVSGKFPWNLVYPKLKAEAYKNAAKGIGNLFGRRIGREDMVVTEESIVVKKKDQIIADITGGAK